MDKMAIKPVKVSLKDFQSFLEYVYALEEIADHYGEDKKYTPSVARVFKHLRTKYCGEL